MRDSFKRNLPEWIPRPIKTYSLKHPNPEWRKELSQPVIETEAIEVQANVVEAPVEVVPAKIEEKAIVVKTAEPVDVEPES